MSEKNGVKEISYPREYISPDLAMPEQKDSYVTIKVKASTRSELVKMQGLYQLQYGEKVSVDTMIRTLLEAQPRVDIPPLDIIKGRSHEQRAFKRPS